MSIHNVVSETESNTSYHRLIFYETVGDFAFTLKARTVALRNFGPSMSPANAFHIITGIESLPVHMERHISNAGAKAEFLEKQDAVDWLLYAGLTSSPYHGLAKTYIPIGQGSVFTFVVCSGYEAVIKLVGIYQSILPPSQYRGYSVLTLHPASTTHRQLTEEQRLSAGVGPDVIRLTICLETVDDLLADPEQGLSIAEQETI